MGERKKGRGRGEVRKKEIIKRRKKRRKEVGIVTKKDMHTCTLHVNCKVRKKDSQKVKL